MVPAGAFATAGQLADHVQGVIDGQLQALSLGEPGDILVTADGAGLLTIALGLTLDAAAAETDLAAASDGTNSIAQSSVQINYDGQMLPLNVPELSSLDRLLAHIQTAIDSELVSLARSGDVLVAASGGGQLNLRLGHTLDGIPAAEANLAAARYSPNSINVTTLDLQYDGVPVSVHIGNLSSDGSLSRHVQTAVNAAVAGASAGAISPLDYNPVLGINVLLNPSGEFQFTTQRDIIEGLRYPTLGDSSTAEAAIAAARSGNNLDSEVAFPLLLNGMSIPVVVPEGDFADASALRDHVQTFVDNFISVAGAGAPGTVAVGLNAGDEIVFSAGAPAVGPTSVTVNNVAPSFNGLTNTAYRPGLVQAPETMITLDGDLH